MRARASKHLEVAPDDVWRVVSDPHHLPRWWPKVERVEGVSEDHFTQVLLTEKGKPVRADQRVVAREDGRRMAWEQLLAGTPFERLLESQRTEVSVAAERGGTVVALEVDQKLRGWSKMGPFFFSRAPTRQLEDALEALARVCG